MIRNYLNTSHLVKIAWRNVLKQKSAFLIKTGGLTVSIACGLIIYLFVQYHLSFDQFHSKPDQIYRIVTEMHRENIAFSKGVPNPLGKFLRNDYSYADKIARIVTFRDYLILVPEIKNGFTKYRESEGIAFVESDFFTIFNYPLVTGDVSRLLQEPHSAIITERLSKKYFGDEDPIGKTILLRDNDYFKITGILKNLPSHSDRQTEIYASFNTLKTFEPWYYSDNSWGGIDDATQCFVRLNPGVNPSEVEAAMEPYVKRFRPNSKNVHHYKLQPLKEMHFDDRYDGVISKKNLGIIVVVGLFILFTACANFINMATASVMKRTKEIGIKKVMGSSKSDLFWQFILETSLTTLVSTILAFGLSLSILPYLNSFLNTDLQVNWSNMTPLLLFVVFLFLLITFLAGVYPAVVLSGFSAITAIKGKISIQQISGINTRRTLILSQFVISQVLILGMITIAYQLKYIKSENMGFTKEGIVMVPLGLDTTGQIKKVLKSEISRMPGVLDISICRAEPATFNNWNNSIKYDGSSEEVNFRTNIKAADTNYVGLFGLELIAGRNLFPSDTVREYIVNETLVKKLNLASPDQILGKTITANGGSLNGPVIGVVKDFHDRPLQASISPLIITTYSDDYGQYAIKLDMHKAKDLLKKIESIWSAKHPKELFQYQFVDDNVKKFYEAESKTMIMIKIFTLMALFIGSLGLFGMISFMTANKMKELSIRKILGGSLNHLGWILSKEFILLILISLALAAPIAYTFMNRWLSNFAYRIDMEPEIFLLGFGITILVTGITIGFQIIQAVLTNPIKSLRTE